ncbi:hypothetical protein Tco_0268363 [Tanacetum coccineum]
MVEGDDEIKVLGEIYMELESGTHKLIERLSQEKDNQEEALGEFNSTPKNVLHNLIQEKYSPGDFYGFMYDTHDDASISEVAEEVMEMATDQDEALYNQEVVDDSLDDK